MKTLIDLAAGVAGGILGTVFVQQMTKLGGKLPRPFQPKVHGDPAEFIFDKAEDVLGRPVPERVRQKIKPALPFAYGLAGPLVLGVLARRIGRGSIGRTLAAGAIMGTAVWAIGFLGWMPLGGLAEPVHRQPIGATAQGIVGHAAYGVLSALPVAFTSRFV